MKKILLLITGVLFIIKIFSQGYASDFTMSDTHGNTYNLYDELDQGKVVVLNFFYTTCPSCQHGVPTLDSIWQSYGATGNSVWVWGIEGVIGPTSATNAEVDTFCATYGATYPCFSTDFNDDTILYIYGIYATPQYYVICPDHKMIHVPIDSVGDYIPVCFHISTSKSESFSNSKLNILLSDDYIIVKSDLKPCIIDIYDLYGRKIFQKIIKESDLKIQKSLLGKGIFIIRQTFENGTVNNKKFFIE
ncbi:MAG: hypothetical protein Kow0068_11520 [Marinilabiliales bacterium]